MASPIPPKALAMISGAGLDPALITMMEEGYSASLWRVDTPTGDPRAVLKRAGSSPARILAERAALDFITHHGTPAVANLTPRVLAADTSHDVRSLLLSWMGNADTCTLEEALEAGEEVAESLERFGHLLASFHAMKVPKGSSLKLSDDPLPLPARLRAMQQRAIDQFERRHKRSPFPDYHELRSALEVADDALKARLCDTPGHIEDYPGRLIHRDLRAANVLLAGAPSARSFAGVVDFERAAASDHAWDFVKLRAWIFARWPRAEAHVLRGYQKVRALPDEERITTFTLHEALTTIGFFAGRHEGYTKEAVQQVAAFGL